MFKPTILSFFPLISWISPLEIKSQLRSRTRPETGGAARCSVHLLKTKPRGKWEKTPRPQWISGSVGDATSTKVQSASICWLP